MLTVSLHGIQLFAAKGLYPEENILGNKFEVDVDIWLSDGLPWAFVDYTLINDVVAHTMSCSGEILEGIVLEMHTALKIKFPGAEKIRVALRKLQPPMPGRVAYAQVCYINE